MGNKEWQRNFTGDYGYWVSTVHETEDSTYLAGGGKGTDAINGQPIGNIGMLREYSKDGSLKWEKEYYPDTSDPHNKSFALVRHMDRGEDGSLIFTGWKHLNPIINPDSSEEGWVYKTDSEGNLLWMRGFRYHELGEHILWNVREVEQKRILAVGRNAHPDTTHGRGSPWVLKLDSMGCVTPGCRVGVEEEGPELTSAFTVFPNPNEGRFRIRSERGEGRFEGTLTVRDMKGRVLLKRSLRGTYPFEEEIKLPDMKSGVILTIWEDKKGYFIKRIVIK